MWGVNPGLNQKFGVMRCGPRFYDECPKFNSDVEDNVNTFAGILAKLICT
jgi:hypothetical protein